MKKLLIAFLLIISISIPSYAKVGNIAGQYYWTDITAVLNGSEIDSINIGGQTLISAEDMYYHSFSVWWRPDERILDVYFLADSHRDNLPEVSKPEHFNLKVGAVRGNYYETDIVTLLDGKPITSYNVGGRTYILAEEMADFGYIVQWDEKSRRLTVTSMYNAGYVYNITVTKDEPKDTEGTGSFSVEYNDGVITSTGDTDYFKSSLSLNADGFYRFRLQFYQYAGLFYSTKLQEKLRALASSGYGVDVEIDPAQMFDLVNKTVKFLVNGQEAKQVKLERGAGSGHQDYEIVAMDLPRYTKTELKEFKISVE